MCFMYNTTLTGNSGDIRRFRTNFLESSFNKETSSVSNVCHILRFQFNLLIAKTQKMSGHTSSCWAVSEVHRIINPDLFVNGNYVIAFTVF